jgi:SAM-dependent methyltransferase
MSEPDHAAHPGPERMRRDGYALVDCERCGFAHVRPMPTPAQLAELYRQQFYESPLYIARYREDRAWWDLVNDDRLDELEAALGGARGRLLDVGSGPGLLVERAAARGWRALGIEPGSQAVAASRAAGLEVVEAFLDERSAPTLGTFDAVHSAVVLEHVPDAAGLLRLVRGLLRPGGALLLAVPNDDNPVQRAAAATLGIAPWWFGPPHHLNYFTPVTLPRLLRRVGFEVVDLSTSFPIEQFLLMEPSYLGDDERGRAAHRRRMAFELAMDAAGQRAARRALARARAQAGIGRELVVVARRVERPEVDGGGA